MSIETFSIIVKCQYDPLLSNTLRVHLTRVDTNEEVHLSEGIFLLRISTDENTAVERCLIRHLSSGREAYVQGGPKLRAFIETCLLNGGETGG